MKNSFLFSVIALVISVFSLVMVFSVKPDDSGKQKDLLAEVLKKHEIRIGYVINPPWLIKDPNSGKLSGIYYDTVEQMGKNLDLKMNWTEETGFATFVESLNTGRFDMVVGGIWPSSVKSKRVDFSVPIYFSAIGVYTKPGDDRLKDLNNINNNDITIAVVDGDMSSIIAKNTFPQAKVLSLNQDVPLSQMLLNVKTGKADVTFVEKVVAEDFLDNNPDAVENIVPDNPIRTFGNTIVLPKGQNGFESMINTSINELIDNGAAERLIKKYDKHGNSFIPVAKSYQAPQ